MAAKNSTKPVAFSPPYMGEFENAITGPFSFQHYSEKDGKRELRKMTYFPKNGEVVPAISVYTTGDGIAAEVVW